MLNFNANMNRLHDCMPLSTKTNKANKDIHALKSGFLLNKSHSLKKAHYPDFVLHVNYFFYHFFLSVYISTSKQRKTW